MLALGVAENKRHETVVPEGLRSTEPQNCYIVKYTFYNNDSVTDSDTSFIITSLKSG
jgi:hypothetical protein